jgi:hypothetical protein
VPNVGLSFMTTGKIMKDLWRVCRETAERETERLSSVKTEKIVKEVWRVCRETAERETERLSSLKTGKIVKEVCRICRETTELETQGLCPDCAWIKVQIRLRFPDAARRTLATAGECERTGCLCGACSRGTIGRHPFYLAHPAQADRETHLHPRCHELWLETAKGRPEQA